MSIDYDKFGHCVNCHKDMIFEQVVDSKVVKRFTADKTEKQFVLNDGSKINVCICKKCKAIEGNESYIMGCLIKGWEVETDELVKDELKENWDKSTKKKYMDRMNKLKIISTAEGKDKYTIEQEIKRYKEKINGSNK